MSKSLFIALVVLAAIGYYLHKTNYFADINARFDYTPDGVSVEARDMDLHDCKLSVTNDFAVEIPFLRTNSPAVIDKTNLKQWNGTDLESMHDLGEKIHFKMRCREGKIEKSESNRYYETASTQPQKKASDSGEVTDSN